MSTVHNFNAGRKSWKMYAKELTSISGDDLTITPYDGEDLILEVSGNGNILFKEDGITYNLADLSNAASGGASDINSLSDCKVVSNTSYFIGFQSGNSATGAYNTSLGYQAGKGIINKSYNTYIGARSGRDNNASNSCGVGEETLRSNSGNDNTAVGAFASCVITGNSNTSLGLCALYQGSGSRNVAIGFRSLFNGSSGNNNITIGYKAEVSATNASNQIVIGADSIGIADNCVLIGNTSTTASYLRGTLTINGAYTLPNSIGSAGQMLKVPSSGTALEWASGGASDINSLSDCKVVSNTSYFIGFQSGNSATGAYNTSLGYQAGKGITNKSYNTYIGARSGRDNNASNSCGVGEETLRSNSGNDNTAVGAFASCVITGNSNTSLGLCALYQGSGSRNVAIGFRSLFNGSSGNNNITIGYKAEVSATNASNQIVIGADSIGIADNCVLIGNTSTTASYLRGTLTINGAYTLPNSIGSAGQMLKVPSSGTALEWASGNSSSSAVNDASFNNVEISNNLLINGHINFEQTDSQVVASDPSGIVNLVNNLLTSNNDASFDNVDISGDLSVNGDIDISGHIIITVDDVNSQNTTLLELKTNSNTPRIKHDFWQNSSGYADYQIYPTSASTTDFKIGGYDATFQTIRLNAVNGIQVYSNQSTNSYGNIKCNDASFNNVDISGDLTLNGNVASTDVTASGNVTATGSVTAGSFTTAGNVTATGNVIVTNNVAAGSLTTTGILTCNAITSTGDSTMEKLTVDSVVLDGTTITDGTATLNAGALSGVTTIGCGAITSTGTVTVNKLGVGTTNPIYNLDVNGAIQATAIRLSGSRGYIFHHTHSTLHPHLFIGDIDGGRYGIDFKYAGAAAGLSNTLFRCYAQSSSVTNGWFQIFCNGYHQKGTWHGSDDRYKHGEINIVNGLETIRQLVPKTYKKTNINLGADNDGTNIGDDWSWESGLIAQEIEKIPTLNEYVTELDGYKYVKYNDIHCHTISAVKELDAIVTAQADTIQAQKTEIEELKNQNNTFKNALNQLLLESGRDAI